VGVNIPVSAGRIKHPAGGPSAKRPSDAKTTGSFAPGMYYQRLGYVVAFHPKLEMRVRMYWPIPKSRTDDRECWITIETRTCIQSRASLQDAEIDPGGWALESGAMNRRAILVRSLRDALFIRTCSDSGRERRVSEFLRVLGHDGQCFGVV